MAASLGGMNEKGLWAATLWVHTPPEVKYQEKNRKPTINNWQFQQYILDNFQNVEEVIKGMSKIRISSFEEGDFVVAIHWFIADASGDSAIIEFPNGKLAIHRNPEQKVMTNSFYERSQEYLKLHEGFGGKYPIPDPDQMDPTSENRYLVASYLAKLAQDVEPNISTKTALDIMSKVKQTVNKHAATSDSITQWTIAYDLANKQVAWYTKLNPKIRKLNMADIDFSPQRQTFNVNSWYLEQIKKGVSAL
jgi:penicillin V acylase-like amidase (Ntn superfamily)